MKRSEWQSLPLRHFVMRFRHIIWDWNGTLLDDAQAGVNAINAMLAARGLSPITLSHYRDVFASR
jgi:phosphoglycolate phosphatase